MIVPQQKALSRGRATNVDTDLYSFRMRAARCSGGTSRGEIKKLVLDIMKSNGVQGKVLDFGAGGGELISILAERGLSELSAVDILERPSDLPERVVWYRRDLNEPLNLEDLFDAVICSEVIEHLENPRSVFRNIAGILKPKGSLILTMPNQENIRAFLTLMFRGHFASFLEHEYPAHITALLRLDLVRICRETGFTDPACYYYADYGWMPLTKMTWQKFSFNILGGRLFSDAVGIIVRKA
jgi:2-polyprenyl-3-methyl-5-hydroxy-6-metoxy-1,4-benzoquinol methylase